MSEHAAAPAIPAGSRFHGYLAEFDTVPALLEACEQVRDAGYTKWDAHTPYPVHGLNDAMGLRATRLPYFVFLCGLTGCAIALLMQWWMNAVDYPYSISGKPIWSIPANIPVVFELTVLLSAFGTFFGMFGFNGLPRYHHPVFYSKRFEAATTDRYFIAINADDPKFEKAGTRGLLERLQPLNLEELVVEE